MNKLCGLRHTEIQRITTTAQTGREKGKHTVLRFNIIYK